MSRADDFIVAALKTLSKPGADAEREEKRDYTQNMSNAIAPAIAAELYARGLIEARPIGDGEDGGTKGAERRISGAIGAKKVDVTWATEEAGLLFAISIKCVMWADGKTGNFQKNMTNRRSDLLFESVTLHRRFPYSVLGGLMLFHDGAKNDATKKRSSTFVNAHRALKLFTGRSDPAGRDEQYERLYVGLVDDNPFSPSIKYFEAGTPDVELPLDRCLDDLLRIVVERDPDLWALVGPNGEKEPGTEVSPLSIADFTGSGTLRKRKPKKVATPAKVAKAAKKAAKKGRLEPTLLSDTTDDGDTASDSQNGDE